jgi:hypothetical protein
VIFSGLEDATRNTLKSIKNELETFVKSEAFGSLSATNKKTVMDKLNNINEKYAIADTTITSWGRSFKQWKAAREELEKAVAAQEALNANPLATKEQKEEARKRVSNASEGYNLANGKLDASTKKIVDLSNAITSLGNSSNTSLVQIWNFTESIINAFSKSGNVISSKVGGIIGAILGILDSIGSQDIDKWANNIANKIFTAIGSAVDSKYSLLHYLAGGLLGAKNKNYDDDMKNLENSNKSLEKAIDRLTEKLKDAYTEDIKSTYEKQLKDYKTEEANKRKEMSESGANYSNGFLGLGGKHSSNSKINDSMSSSDWMRVTKATGVTVTSASAFWNLTAEQMSKLFDNDLEMYMKIQDLANDGFSDAAKYMDDYVALAEKEKKLQDEMKQK